MVVRKSKKEEAERRRREQQRIFVEGLQRYKSKGIQILIDGRECRPEEYRKLCEFREDGSFYMADYVGAETGLQPVIREVPFCPYLDSPPDFSFGENGENCLDGAITVTGYLCVNSNLLQGK